jgi:predicted AlkP superfamily phosphohydrolase/phosphomutase
MNPRVFVLGVDGLNEAIWRHLRDAGLAPFLTRLITHTLPLQSTTPAHTAPAWTSIATGLNPGRHGVLNFWQRTATVPVSWRSCPLVTRAAQPFFWELAHQQGV